MCALAAAVLTLAPACGGERDVEPRPSERVVLVADPTAAATASPTPTARAKLTPPPARLPKPSSVSGAAVETIKMTWYAMGTRTASGEPVRTESHNCAGASRFPMFSKHTVRNPENSRSVVVRINDRGGFEGMGRSLDCMPGVWHALGIPLGRGVATVELVA